MSRIVLEHIDKFYGENHVLKDINHTTFAGYITERQNCSIQEAVTFSAALVSLKMETPGPFMGTREDVLQYIKEFY